MKKVKIKNRVTGEDQIIEVEDNWNILQVPAGWKYIGMVQKPMTWAEVDLEAMLNTPLQKHEWNINTQTFNTIKKETSTYVPPKLNEITISKLYKYSPLNKYTGLEGKFPVRAPTTFVGVEIELENITFKCDPPNTCAVTDDGSLKVKGKEFVTIPIQVKYLEVELERLFGSLKTVHPSSRCSVHVHLNVRDFTLEELKTFIALYMIFEKSLYNFSGNRWNNNFCIPLGMNPSYAATFIHHIDRHGVLNEQWKKYFGFNLSPIFGGESSKIGTIEFRHMKGNTDIKYILNWINLIVSLKLAAKKIPFNELKENLSILNTDSSYYVLADVIFKDFKELITGQKTFKEDVESCITITKTVFLPKKVCNIIIPLNK